MAYGRDQAEEVGNKRPREGRMVTRAIAKAMYAGLVMAEKWCVV